MKEGRERTKKKKASTPHIPFPFTSIYRSTCSSPTRQFSNTQYLIVQGYSLKKKKEKEHPLETESRNIEVRGGLKKKGKQEKEDFFLEGGVRRTQEEKRKKKKREENESWSLDSWGLEPPKRSSLIREHATSFSRFRPLSCQRSSHPHAT